MKEKAKNLVEKFDSMYSCDGVDLNKECALICVDEKQKTIDKMFNGYYTMPKEWQKEYDELREIKQEINKL